MAETTLAASKRSTYNQIVDNRERGRRSSSVNAFDARVLGKRFPSQCLLICRSSPSGKALDRHSTGDAQDSNQSPDQRLEQHGFPGCCRNHLLFPGKTTHLKRSSCDSTQRANPDPAVLVPHHAPHWKEPHAWHATTRESIDNRNARTPDRADVAKGWLKASYCF